MNCHKILYICPNGYLGGAERIVCNISSGHLTGRYKNFNVLFFSDGETVAQCKELGIETHVLPFKFRMDYFFYLLPHINARDTSFN